MIPPESKDRPFVRLSMAQSLDGQIATRTGDSRYISCPQTLELAHQFRQDHDAILVGVGTVLQDDPMLTCRLEQGCTSQPIRVVLDTNLRTPVGAKIVKTANQYPTLIVCKTAMPSALAAEAGAAHAEHKKAMAERTKILNDAGVRVIALEDMELASVFYYLRTQEAIERLFVEGGKGILTAFIKQRLFDRLSLVIAPMMLGQGIGVSGDLGVDTLNQAIRFNTVSTKLLGTDLVWELEPVRV